MLNDYQGDPSEFAMVVPVPVVLGKDDVRIAAKRIFERLDAYSTPRLVEYFDPDPWEIRTYLRSIDQRSSASDATQRAASVERTRTLGVKIENSFAVGEYEILIFSAKQSDGLETWLSENGYRLRAVSSNAAMTEMIVTGRLATAATYRVCFRSWVWGPFRQVGALVMSGKKKFIATTDPVVFHEVKGCLLYTSPSPRD